jgi:hypothetical protein
MDHPNPADHRLSPIGFLGKSRKKGWSAKLFDGEVLQIERLSGF